MRNNEEKSPWAIAAPDAELSDPEITPSTQDPRADAAMLLFETFINRYRAHASELRQARASFS
jgi:hypothetical protein